MDITEKYIDKRNEILQEKMIKSLERRGYEGYYAKNREEAVNIILSLIPNGASVSWGGSMTLDDMGIKEELHKGDYVVLDRDKTDYKEDRVKIMKAALTCDVFLSSVNAMTVDGEMINIDGNGNRIAAIAFGPETVILAVGMNKVCPDMHSARARARNFAAPVNVLKLGVELPCTKTGTCMDCNHPECACAQIVEMRMNRIPGRIKVVLIGEDMGL